MILITNSTLVTRDEQNPFIRNGAVAMDGNKIVEVGDSDKLKSKYSNAEVIDAKGAVVMPAFVNMHEHIYSALARGLNVKGYSATDFLTILDGMWWTLDRNLDNEFTKYSAIQTYIECVKNGVTTIFDHHASFGEIDGSLDAIEEAAREIGVRSCLCYEISDRDGMEKSKKSVLENSRFIKKTLKNNDDFIKAMCGMHAQFTISDETFEFARSETPKEVGFHIHIAEGIEDLHDCLLKHGKRIIDRLDDFDILGPKTLLGHCIYVNDHEMDRIKASDTMIVHNPESNMGNACGCPPTMRQVEKGILTGLGTDGYTHDMIESYKVANILHKHHLCTGTAAWAEVPQMLFENNPKMANRYFDIPLGKIKEGYAADVIVTDYYPHTPMDQNNINGNILFGMNGRSVVTTIGNGKILMKDRVLTMLDEEKTLSDIAVKTKKLWDKINK